MEIAITDYQYTLPEHRIARYPLPERDQSKLLVYRDQKINHTHFYNLADYLPSDSFLFFNNTKVIPARLILQKETGAEIEIFLLTPVRPSPIVGLAMCAQEKYQWHCAIGNAKRWKQNSLKMIRDELILSAQFIDREKSIVEFEWNLPITFSEVLHQIGNTPLPPYFHRSAEIADAQRYQTIYSKHDGAVAAPTAGLHFTEKTFAALAQKNITTDYLTLHVSAGTFQPIKTHNVLAHSMHVEQIIITKENIKNLLVGKKNVAVGTTSLRTLESLYWYGVKLIENPESEFLIDQHDPYRLPSYNPSEAIHAVLHKMEKEKLNQLMGETSIYIYPEYDFKMVDALITNFHQPSSTLILLVAAFVGNDWKKIYADALANDYRFLSYGDSSLLFKKN